MRQVSMPHGARLSLSNLRSPMQSSNALYESEGSQSELYESEGSQSPIFTRAHTWKEGGKKQSSSRHGSSASTKRQSKQSNTGVSSRKTSMCSVPSSSWQRNVRFKDHRDSHSHGRDPAHRLRQKAAWTYNECMEVAMCRLKAAEVANISPPTREPSKTVQGEQMLGHAWLHSHLPALRWVQHSLNLHPDSKPVLIASEHMSSKRQLRTLTTLDFGAFAQGALRPKQETHQIEDGQQQDTRCTDLRLESSSNLREAFRISVSEAKLAQAQSLAAWRDVQRLTAVLERGNRMQNGKRLGSAASKLTHAAGSGASSDMGAAQSQLGMQLRGQRNQLKRLEVSLKKELEDVLGQISRLQAEISRRQQRAERSPASGGALEWDDCQILGDSPQPSAAPSNSGDRAAKSIPKYLASSRVLPHIGASSSCQSSPRHTPRQSPRRAHVSAPSMANVNGVGPSMANGTCLTPRTRAARTVPREVFGRSEGTRARLLQPVLPNLSRACTAP